MQNYQINGKEDGSDKETVCAPSMENLCMDGSGTECIKKNTENTQRPGSGPKRFRIAVAGLTGVLLCAGTGGSVFGAQGQELYKSGEEQRSAVDWNEEEILERWDLDPDHFPSDRRDSRPDIPDEYLPYFEDAASEAVAWYAGERPPETDLSGYSPRADAIRRAAAEKASESLHEEYSRFMGMTEQILTAAGGSSGQELVGALQDDLFSRPVQTHSLASWKNSFGRDPDDSALMTAGKIRNDRTNGASSVSWFLNEPGEAQTQSEKKESAKGAPAQGGKVMSPAFRYLMTPPNAESTSPDAYRVRDENLLPLPIGIYPYTGSYFTAPAAEESAGEEDHQDEDRHDREDRQEDRHGSEDGGEEDRQRRDSFVPLRDYRETKGSADFYGRRRTIFIGDSRTVGMEMSCGGMPEEYWSAKTSMGYSWMVSTGIPSVENLIGPNTDVVILMGVNDLGNVYRYVDHINMKAAEWKKLGARTFFVSVTPVDDRRSPNAKNSRIESFNAYALDNFRDVYYIDAYNRIRYSYGSPDGIHYDGATYREIYRIIEFSLYQGWYEQNGLWFYFDLGRPLTGWQYLDGQWQYMDGYGVRWIRDGRVGDRICVPLPDFTMSGQDCPCPVF